MKRDIEIAKVVAENVAKAPCPQIVIVGGASGNGGSPAETALKVMGAERAVALIERLGSTKPKK